ncbi:hypothetical protein B296_00044716 [Ensete ventricosum]|uniref:Uncharacterized protein n=1 Tax=Ensete ventricosum TaxID=4639 RepID=A0A426Y3A5_ENSVE|nr:hypothetical protein B296_00044716 [Ensete ventricosum]
MGGGSRHLARATAMDGRGGWVTLEGATTMALDLQEGRVSKAKRGCEGCDWQRRKEEGSDSPVRVTAAGESKGERRGLCAGRAATEGVVATVVEEGGRGWWLTKKGSGWL